MGSETTYRDAGVDIDAGNRAVALMKDAVAATQGPEVLAGVGAFGGLYSLAGLSDMTDPVLAASADGVGTKVRIATRYGRLDGIGKDLVNHCVDDILVQGARPLFFLDYVASSKLDPVEVAAIVSGMAEACTASGCALLGGETAEMPGVYADGEVDVVGTIVGVVDRHKIIDGTRIEAGDVVLGIGSASPHTNGYSLIRHVLGDLELDAFDEELGDVPLDLLLRPHRSYYSVVQSMLDAGIDIRGMVHITGGGFIENPPRILSSELSMNIDRTTWSVPRLYSWLQERGSISDAEMFRVFNMGIGLLVIIPQEQMVKAKSAAVNAVPQGDDWTVEAVGDIQVRNGAPVTFEPSLID